jgi:hypothetical protein
MKNTGWLVPFGPRPGVVPPGVGGCVLMPGAAPMVEAGPYS